MVQVQNSILVLLRQQSQSSPHSLCLLRQDKVGPQAPGNRVSKVMSRALPAQGGRWVTRDRDLDLEVLSLHQMKGRA
jgi:hypothetical protein